MGMFDRIWFKCPKCGEVLEHQSKAGACVLADHQETAVPQEIAEDIKGEQVWCGHCDCNYSIVMLEPPKTATMGLARGNG